MRLPLCSQRVSNARVHLCARCLCLVLVAVLIASHPGCASGTEQAEAGSLTEGTAGGTRGAGPQFTRSGIEVRKWVVQDDADIVGSALMSVGQPAPLDRAMAQHLRRNGLRIVRIPVSELESIESTIGVTGVDLNAWFGQVLDWQVLHDRAVGRSPRAVAIDGRVRSVVDGAFEMLVRAWTVEMEDGPRFQLQVASTFTQTGRRHVPDLLEEDSFQGEFYQSASFETLLDAGFAYLITCERPDVTWRDSTPTRANADRSKDVPSVGPFSDVGPGTIAPVTLGEALLRSEPAGGTRGVIVIVPRIPDSLFPPAGGLGGAEAAAAGGG